MSGDRSAAHAAYRRTTYRATLDGVALALRIDETSAPLDACLRARGVEVWAFMTAANPHAVQLGEAENAARHAELIREVERAGHAFAPGESEGDDADWPAEASLLVLGIAEADACALARRFAQEAIVFGARGEPARLVLCGTRRPRRPPERGFPKQDREIA